MALSKTYEAFKAAGAPDDKAREAAEEIARMTTGWPTSKQMSGF